MKKIYTAVIALLLTSTTFAQVYYDNGPIITSANRFVPIRSWPSNNITYSFSNGTGDITGDDERAAVLQAFQIWSDYANINFTEVPSNGDIQIGWYAGDHGDGSNNAFDGPFGVLAHAFFPPPNGSFAGDIHFDEAEVWTTAERFDPFQPMDLVTVAVHEIGHAIGLDHSAEPCALMDPVYNGSHRYLAPDDVAGARFLYGPRSPLRTSNLNCFGGTFFINNLPNGATVNWVSSNTAIATVNNINNQGIVSRVGNANGNVRITGTITLPCGETLVEFMDIRIGIPPIASNGYLMIYGTGMYPDGYSNFDLQRFSPYLISINDFNVTNTYFWSVSNNLSMSGQGNYEIEVLPFGAVGSFLSIAVQPENECGRNSGITVSGTITSTGGGEGLFTVGPNPTSNNIFIRSLNNNNSIKEVRILDKFGKVRKIIKGTKNTQLVNINISDLPVDVYYLQLFDGSKWINKSIIKTR